MRKWRLWRWGSGGRAYGALDELALNGGERGDHAEAALIEHVHRHHEAVALAAEHVLDRHAAVLQVHLCDREQEQSDSLVGQVDDLLVSSERGAERAKRRADATSIPLVTLALMPSFFSGGPHVRPPKPFSTKKQVILSFVSPVFSFFTGVCVRSFNRACI